MGKLTVGSNPTLSARKVQVTYACGAKKIRRVVAHHREFNHQSDHHLTTKVLQVPRLAPASKTTVSTDAPGQLSQPLTARQPVSTHRQAASGRLNGPEVPCP